MATVEQTMMKVQRLLTGPLGLQVTVSKDVFIIRFRKLPLSVDS